MVSPNRSVIIDQLKIIKTWISKISINQSISQHLYSAP